MIYYLRLRLQQCIVSIHRLELRSNQVIMMKWNWYWLLIRSSINHILKIISISKLITIFIIIKYNIILILIAIYDHSIILSILDITCHALLNFELSSHSIKNRMICLVTNILSRKLGSIESNSTLIDPKLKQYRLMRKMSHN